MPGLRKEVSSIRSSLADDQPIAVVGVAGIGKTTVIRAALADVETPVFEGGALASLHWMPYLPIARALGVMPRSRPPDKQGPNRVADWLVGQIGSGVLVVEDLQWADQDTLALLPLLAGRVKLVCSLRSGDPGSKMVREWAEGAGCRVIELSPLSPTDCASLARRWMPSLSTEELDRAVADAHGNPNVLQHILAGTATSRTFRLVLRAQIRRLRPEAIDALGMLGLAGGPLDKAMVPSKAAKTLIDAGFAVGDGCSLTVPHPSIGSAAIDLIGSERRRALHLEIGRTIDTPAEAAWHFAAAGDRPRAHSKALEAAALTPSTVERASYLALAAKSSSGRDSDRMRLQAASPLVAVGKYEEAEELLSSVAADEPEMQAEAALVLARARIWQGELAAANREVDRGLALVSGAGVPIEVRLWIERAHLSLLLGRVSDSRRLVERAQSLIGATGVDRGSATWLTGCRAFQDGEATCLDRFRAAIVTAQETGDLMLECEAEASLMDALQAFGEAEAARARATHMIARARALDLRGWEETFRYVLARLNALCRGAYAEAVPALEALLVRGHLGVRRKEACALLAHVLAHLGDEAAARTWLARETGKTRDAWAADLLILVAGEVNWLAGRPEQALAGIEDSRANGTHYPTPLTSLHGLIERWALLDLGFAPGPELEIDLPGIEGARTESAALARMIDRHAALEAEDLFEEAAGKWASHSASSEIRCIWAAGEAARRAGKLDRARRRLRIAEQRARQRGFEPLLQRIRVSLREAGVNRRTAAVSAPVLKAKSGRELTSREREVLRLVGAGLSTRDVARLLHIAPSTVETQIRSGMRKLGATTRVQAASLIWFRAEGTDADNASSTESSTHHSEDEADQ